MPDHGTTTLPAPPAPRVRRPSWRDTRLVIGLLIILASVVAGARVVAAADDTVPVFAAKRTLPVGTPLTAALVDVVRVHLPGTAPYLSAAAELPPGRVVLRTTGAGELVPESAVGPASAMAGRPVTIPLDDEPPAGLVAGALVDVWASRKAEATATTAYGSARRLVASVEVSAVGGSGGALSARRTVPVQVMVPAVSVAPLLDALANGARMALVPVPGSAPTEAGS